MALDKNDLKAIKEIVAGTVDSRMTKSETYLKDYVDFSAEKSEIRITDRFGKEAGALKKDIVEIKADIKDIKQNVDDIIETNQKFLDILGNHDNRIRRVEAKVAAKRI
ncbi:MAG: hypothetical protein Q7S80_01635 [bacterium]|nr:hypothetical protein [bacterium]